MEERGSPGGSEAVGSAVAGRQCSVPEAARQLGISERAVRFRITSGSLVATRMAQGWQVTLPAVEKPCAPIGAQGSDEQGGKGAVAEGGWSVGPEAIGGNG